MELKNRVKDAEIALANQDINTAIDHLVYAKEEGVRVGLATKDPHLWLRIYVLLSIAYLKRGPNRNFDSYLNIARVQQSNVKTPSQADEVSLQLLDLVKAIHSTPMTNAESQVIKDKLECSFSNKWLPAWCIPLLKQLIVAAKGSTDLVLPLQKILLRALETRPFTERKSDLKKLIELMTEAGKRNDSGTYLIQYLDMLLEQTPRPIVEIAQTHRRLAWVLLANNAVTKAILHMDKGLRELEYSGLDKNLKAAILCDKAVMESNRGTSNRDCIPMIVKAIAIATHQADTTDILLLARLWNVHADFLLRAGDKVGAAESKRKSAEYFSEDPKPQSINAAAHTTSTQKPTDKPIDKPTAAGSVSKATIERLTAADFAANTSLYEPTPIKKASPTKSFEPVDAAIGNTENVQSIPTADETAAAQTKVAPVEVGNNYSATAVEASLAGINQMTGLKAAKETIKKLADFYRFQQIRALAGHQTKTPPRPHMFFLGNPGTGKTTLARLMGQLFYALGVAKSAEVIEVGRGDLVGQYIGQTAQLTAAIIAKAQGKTLFIDEAYSLAKDSPRDFGQEAIDALVQAMTDPGNEMIVIAAGYPKKMSLLLAANPGLASRIIHHVTLDDYIPEELMQIADALLEQRGMVITSSARDQFSKKITDLYRSRDETFGNARLAGTLVSKVEQALSSRMVESSSEEDDDADMALKIIDEDIEKAFEITPSNIPVFKVDEELLSSQLKNLEDLVGLTDVKDELQEIIALARYYKEEGKNVLEAFSLNIAFLGAPGTGKTTVARILSDALKTLGVIERGHLVECDRASLITGRGDGTAGKVTEVFESALGGTLFIDEVYALVNSPTDSFGYEAVNTLVKLIEDNRGKICVIIAGYKEETDEFLKTNPGLKSRFDKLVNFPDYSLDELSMICKNTILKSSLQIEHDAMQLLKEHIQSVISADALAFGNARGIRKLMESVIRKQHLRLSKIPVTQRTVDIKSLILKSDIQDALAKINSTDSVRKRVGF